jgi:ClpP class serine protease
MNKAHNIVRLASTIFNTPQLITAEGFDPIAKYLSRRITDADFAIYKKEDDEKYNKDEDDLEMIGSVGVVQISGSLSYRPVYTLCGEVGTSYMGLIEQTQALIDAGAKTIVYEVDSPGGMAAHCFDTADTLREMLTEAGVKSIAYLDGTSASAAYALSCIADEVIAHPSASAGSVGCIVCLLSDAKALEQEGYKRLTITSTPGKSPFAEDGSFSEQFLNKLQEDVNRLGAEFVAHVAKFTGVSEADIAAQDAQCFHAEAALEKGLVNAIMNHREFSAYVAANYS